jgi:hypothetical protein
VTFYVCHTIISQLQRSNGLLTTFDQFRELLLIQTLFYYVLIFFIYGNYHAKIAEKISFVSLDKESVLGRGKGLS